LLESYPANVRVIHIPCSGRIDPQMALLALRAGIDGVLVCAVRQVSAITSAEPMSARARSGC